MRIEHIALIVKDPIKMATWYCQNLGFIIVKEMDKTPFSHFIADSTKTVFLEIYNPGNIKIPKYKKLNPVVFHLAFLVKNVKKEKDTLILAGASLVNETATLATGDIVAMLRDPWGVPFQLVKRKQ
jgi:catechol 2,3-dioxygenase-like lactoylglutathione lyase family enzyme